MKSVIISAALALLFSTQVASAQSISKQLHDIGDKSCTLVMQDKLEGVNGEYYRDVVDKYNVNRKDFCSCVAEDFSKGNKEDLAKLTKSTMRVDHLASHAMFAMIGCMPSSASGEFSDFEIPDTNFYLQEDIQSPINKLGRKACRAVLNGQEAKFGEKHYRSFVDLLDMDDADVCGCVAYQFEVNEEEQRASLEAAGEAGAEEAFLDITKRNLDICLPKFDEIELALQGMIMRGAPEGSHEMAEAQNAMSGDETQVAETDKRICQMITRGEIVNENFDTDYLSTWEKQSELKGEDLCGECVAMQMQDTREQAIEDGSSWKENDEAHQNEVAGSILNCMRFTFKTE